MTYPIGRNALHALTSRRAATISTSEFAGCASSFKGAMLVNPYDPDKVAETIHSALTMPVRAPESGIFIVLVY